MGKKFRFTLIYLVFGCSFIGAAAIGINFKNQNHTVILDKSLSADLTDTDSIALVDQKMIDEIAATKTETKAILEASRKARLEAEANAKAEAEAKAAAEAKAQAEAKAKAQAEAKARAEALAKAQAEEKAKQEAQARMLAQQGDLYIQQLLANPNPNVGPISLAILKYMASEANRNSVLNKAYYLHYGDTKNTCVYFASEELRRSGVSIPTWVSNTGQLIEQLSSLGWSKYIDYTQLVPGDICFTTNDPSTDAPTHTYTFLGYKTAGSYEYAWVLDNQASDYGGVFHERNVSINAVYNRKFKEAFQFFMRK